VRSSLYVCFPAVGASLIGVALGAAMWRTMSRGNRRAAATALAVLPLALLPVYHSRNARMKAEAELSAHVTSAVRDAVSQQPGISRIVIYDDPGAEPAVASSFNWALPEAMEVAVGRPTAVELRSGPPPAAVGDDPTTLVLVRKNALVVRP
jgi:hypothetical protein